MPASSYAAAPAPISPVATPVPLARPITPFARQAAAGAPAKSDRKSSFPMGLLGGLLGVLVGATVYYLVFKVTGLPPFGFRTRMAATFLAIGLGGLAGWAAELLGRGEGSKELGLITATLVVAGVIGTQYLVTLGWWHKTTHEFADIGFKAMVDEAKEIVKAIPTGSDAEIRMYLARQTAGDGDVVKPASVSEDEVKNFREKELPEYQNLASGKETKEQFFAKQGIDTKKLKEAEDTVEDTFKSLFLLQFLSKAGIFSLIASAGLAYKLSTNA